jgi:hypothetical protein
MAKSKEKVVGGGKVYKGSKQNGGRPIVVKHYKENGEWKTTTTNAARHKVEKSRGKKLSRNVDVDHIDNNKNNDSSGNLRTMSHGKNVAKENKRRAGKKAK